MLLEDNPARLEHARQMSPNAPNQQFTVGTILTENVVQKLRYLS